MRRTVLLAAASLLSGGVFAGAGVSVDVRKYGVCESDLLQTAALQAAIDAAAGAGGYAMAQFDPLFARTFFTDFIRSESRTPAAVSGARQAVAKLLKEKH